MIFYLVKGKETVGEAVVGLSDNVRYVLYKNVRIDYVEKMNVLKKKYKFVAAKE